MTDYKVNLPKTNFAMKANLPNKEPEILKFWEGINLYKKICEHTKNNPKFILHDGPPYANGPIHLGHVLNKVLKDIVVKAKSLAGYYAPFIPGWDCHGLPIEVNVEKKYKITAKHDPIKFIQTCREYAASQLELQKGGFKRLGVFADWENRYSTMDFKSEANIIRALSKIIENGYLEKGYKPVHWCIACGSALAEAEVEYQNKISPAIDVKFDFVSVPKFLQVDKVSIPIWTTTPWTLPANEAVALNPELEYALVKSPQLKEPLIIAEALLESSMQRYGLDDYNILTKFKGELLKGVLLKHPFLDGKQVPIIFGEHVTTETGTGAVHTAPGHGHDDFIVGKKYGLPINNPVGSNGSFLPDTPFFAGENVFKANDHVIEVIREKGKLLNAETLEHSYPHCWRHKTPLIFRGTPQWFINLDKKNKDGKTLRTRAIESINEITWMPEDGKKRLGNMIEQRPDWCISRQRLYGTPIALFIHKQTGELHPEWQRLIELVAKNVEHQGVVYWHTVKADEFLRENAKNYPSDDYEKVVDTLDVWFDAGVTHYFVLKQNPELSYPADLYLEAHDQYRGWFQSSLLTGLAMYNEAPYRHVFTHGHVVDIEGRKMSKSMGNVVDPEQIMKTYGADILRLWVASIYYYRDTALSNEVVQGVVDVYRKLRNTIRYMLANLYDFNPAKDLISAEQMLLVDKRAIELMIRLQRNAKFGYGADSTSDNREYMFYYVYDQLRFFAINEKSNFYFDIIKDRLYTMHENSIGRKSAQTALYYILQALVRYLAPVLSFTAEEVWQEMRGLFAEKAESVFLTSWEDIRLDVKDYNTENVISEDGWSYLRAVRSAVQKELEGLRINGKIGSSLEAEVYLYTNNSILNNVLRAFQPEHGESELRFVFITSTANLLPLRDKTSDAVKADPEIIRSELELWIKVVPSSHPKCGRCWHHREDVGSDATYPELCGRCVKNISDGKGEDRFFV